MIDAQRLALEAYAKELKQTQYRLTLLREAERDLKNKKADYEIAHERSESALAALISECRA